MGSVETINILVAGASGLNVDLAKNAYMGLGFQVIPATGLSLALFLAQKNYPDLIISSGRFIDGDGLSFLCEIKNDPDLSKIPFIFLVEKDEIDKTMAVATGASSVIYHPVTAEWLKECTLPIIAERSSTKEKRPEESPE